MVIFPVDPASWSRTSRFLKFTRADQDGAFRVSGPPSGPYLAVAVDVIEGTPGTGEWQDPQLLGELAARAQRLTLQDGERASLTLRLVRR